MRAIRWIVCAALLCIWGVGCGKGVDDLRPTPDKPAAAKRNKAPASKAAAAKEKPADKQGLLRVTGEALTAAYKKNKDEADRQYAGKELEVEAVVAEVHPFGYLLLKAAPGMELPCPSFGADFLKKHPDIAPGKTITLRAKVGVATYKSVTLDDPVLVAPQ
jgi:hypothetical protein